MPAILPLPLLPMMVRCCPYVIPHHTAPRVHQLQIFSFSAPLPIEMTHALSSYRRNF